MFLHSHSEAGGRRIPTGSPKSKFFCWSAFVAVTLIAAFFRFYRLGDHPLGLFFDPAINGLDAVRLMQRGGPVIFFPTNGGREALLIYLLLPFIWLFGTTPFSFRLQLAFISLLTVVFLFGFLYDLRFAIYDLRFTNKRPYPPPVPNSSPLNHSPFAIRYSPFAILLPLLSSLTLAVSYWHIAISRLDQRPLTVPLLAIPFFWFFLKGWLTGRLRWFSLSGLALGLSFHTYSAARLLPIILVLALLPEFFGLPSRWRSATGMRPACRSGLLLFGLTALLVASPMLGYFVLHPSQFSARAASVMVWNFLDSPGAILAELGRNLLRVLGFFCCAGNANAIFGLPGHPGLSPLLTPFLGIGLISAIRQWRHFFTRLVALWWLVGILPSVVAIEAPHPLRLLVALVPTGILVALGLLVVLTWLLSRLSPKPAFETHYGSGQSLPLPHILRFTFYVLPLLPILATIPGTFSAYFLQWPRLQVTQGIFDYGAVAIRNAILERAADSTPLYLPLARYNDAPLLYYLSGPYQRQAALSAPPAERAWVISPEKNETDPVWVRLQGHTATILPPLTSAGQQLIQSALSQANATPIRTIAGETAARLAALPADPVSYVQQPTQNLSATLGAARLVGANYPFTIDPSAGKFPVTLFWQAVGRMTTEYEVLLQLVDDQRQVWGDGTARPTGWVYPTTFWRPGLDTLAGQHNIRFTAGSLSPGRYWLAVALYDPATGQRQPLAEASGGSTDTFLVGPLKAPLPLPAPLPALNEVNVTFGEQIQLLQANLTNPTVPVGDSLHLELLWQAVQTPPLDYTVFVHLLDTAGDLVVGNDTQPVNNNYPTTIWSPAERILDTHTLPLPPDLQPGRYRLAVGLYYQPSGQRLPVYLAHNQQAPGDQFLLPLPVNVTRMP